MREERKMKNNFFAATGIVAAFGLVLVALPSHSAPRQNPEEEQQQRVVVNPDGQNFAFSIGDGGSWLGVGTSEVTADKAKELKLPAERGVVLGKIVENSPASKSGLKENDVVTEINGQRVEGTSQFRRMIREIPAGRTVQLTVWRDGRSQAISVTLGQTEEGHRAWSAVAPGAFAFRMPEMPNLPEVAPLPEMDFDGMTVMSAHPRLGIDAEDLSGQLGTFFGAPEGEGILVRDVSSGSVAEKAGLKAGDVITSLNGDRLRSVGDLRSRLAAHASDKPTTVKLGVLRNKSEISLTIDLPAMTPHTKHIAGHKTNI
jgi:serine protease Do